MHAMLMVLGIRCCVGVGAAGSFDVEGQFNLSDIVFTYIADPRIQAEVSTTHPTHMSATCPPIP